MKLNIFLIQKHFVMIQVETQGGKYSDTVPYSTRNKYCHNENYLRHMTSQLDIVAPGMTSVCAVETSALLTVLPAVHVL